MGLAIYVAYYRSLQASEKLPHDYKILHSTQTAVLHSLTNQVFDKRMYIKNLIGQAIRSDRS